MVSAAELKRRRERLASRPEFRIRTKPFGFTEAWIAVVPEPSTALLLATSLLGLAVGRASPEVSVDC